MDRLSQLISVFASREKGAKKNKRARPSIRALIFRRSKENRIGIVRLLFASGQRTQSAFSACPAKGPAPMPSGTVLKGSGGLTQPGRPKAFESRLQGYGEAGLKSAFLFSRAFVSIVANKARHSLGNRSGMMPITAPDVSTHLRPD
jgi:hypothetical protein